MNKEFNTRHLVVGLIVDPRVFLRPGSGTGVDDLVLDVNCSTGPLHVFEISHSPWQGIPYDKLLVFGKIPYFFTSIRRFYGIRKVSRFDRKVLTSPSGTTDSPVSKRPTTSTGDRTQVTSTGRTYIKITRNFQNSKVGVQLVSDLHSFSVPSKDLVSTFRVSR